MNNILIGAGLLLAGYLWLRSKAKVDRREVELDIEVEHANEQSTKALKRVKSSKEAAKASLEKYNEERKKLDTLLKSSSDSNNGDS